MKFTKRKKDKEILNFIENSEMGILNMLENGASIIAYIPSLNMITGSINASILLQQIYHRWKWNKHKPFYKFKLPCSHKLYKEGDSWCEELGFSESEFNTALKKIATKITKDSQNTKSGIVHYWKTVNRLTYFKINKGFVGYITEDLHVSEHANPDVVSNTNITTNITNNSIINNTVVSKKPLIDKIDSIIYFWNNLPNCTKHSKLNKQSEETKTYITISTYIKNMLNGLPLSSNNDGSPHKIYETFLSKCNIPSDICNKAWTVNEIKNILQSITDDNNSKKKLSLDVAFWNAFAKSRGGGFSLFIYAAAQIDVSNEYKALSDTFTKAINISLNAVKKKQWAWKFEQIIKNNDIPIEGMQNILTWYATVRGGKYIPVIDSPEELEEKYDRLMQAKERDEQSPPSATVDSSKISYSKESLNLFSYEDVEEFKQIYQSLVKFWQQAKIWNTGQVPSEGAIMGAMISIKNWINNRIDDYYGKVAYRLGKLDQVSSAYLDWLEDQNWIKNKTGNILFVNSPLFKRFCSDFEENIMNTPIRSKGWGADEDLKVSRPNEIETSIKQYKEKKTQQEEARKKETRHRKRGNEWAVGLAKKYWRGWSNELLTTLNFAPCPPKGNEWRIHFEEKIQMIEKEHRVDPTMRRRSYSFLYRKYIREYNYNED